jgi:hypothetical protein
MEKSITFEANDQTATKLVLTPEGILYQLLGSSSLTERAVDRLASEPPSDSSPSEANAAKQKDPSAILSGKLKSQPKAGRSDSQGHPTAWARFAAHEEEGAQLYSCTFHRGSARIALGLPTEAQIVVEGYAHPSTEPGRKLPTLSVFRLLHYPGKPEKATP